MQHFHHSHLEAPVNGLSVHVSRHSRHVHDVTHGVSSVNPARRLSIHLLGFLELSRQLQNRCCRLEPIHHGHVEVHEHQSEVLFAASLVAVSFEQFDRLESVLRLEHLNLGELVQHDFERNQVKQVVIHDQARCLALASLAAFLELRLCIRELFQRRVFVKLEV